MLRLGYKLSSEEFAPNDLVRYVKAGFENVCIHQVGADQEGFMRFYAREVMPKLEGRRAAA